MFEWLNGEGTALKHHTPGETNYLRGRLPDGSENKRPFPNNTTFVSESVLSEELRNEVYAQVVERKKSVRAVSIEYGIDMRRVAAVVRLVEMERRQRTQVRLPLILHLKDFVEPVSSTYMMSQTKIRLVLKTQADCLAG